MEEKTRLQFEVNAATLENIEELMGKTGSSTRTEVLRKALGMLDFFVQVKEEGGNVIVRRGDRDYEVLSPHTW